MDISSSTYHQKCGHMFFGTQCIYRVQQIKRPHYKNCDISETVQFLNENFLG